MKIGSFAAMMLRSAPRIHGVLGQTSAKNVVNHVIGSVQRHEGHGHAFDHLFGRERSTHTLYSATPLGVLPRRSPPPGTAGTRDAVGVP